MPSAIAGIDIPDSKLARAITEFVRDTESPLLFHHSSRVFSSALWPAAPRAHLRSGTVVRRRHVSRHGIDAGAQQRHRAFRSRRRQCRPRFPESAGGRAERRRQGLAVDCVAHDTGHSATPASRGRSGDRGCGDGRARPDLRDYSAAEREAVVHAHPRSAHFKEDIIQAFYEGIKHKPETTFGNVKADVLADKDPHFRRGNFCSVIRGSRWAA